MSVSKPASAPHPLGGCRNSGPVDIREHGVKAVLGQRFGAGQSDAARRPRDNRDRCLCHDLAPSFDLVTLLIPCSS